jgi:hypothetical protein
MTKKDDPFAGQLSLPPEFLPTYAKPYATPEVRRRRKQFVLVPMWWAERLSDLSHRDRYTWPLAIHILHRYWKNKNKPFKLANMALGSATKMDRYAKYRALVVLEHRGLVVVERRAGKSPTITPLLIEPENPSTLLS